MKNPLLPFLVRPRLIAGAVIGVIAFALTPHDWRMTTRLLTGWDVGVTAYMAMIAHMIAQTPPAAIARRARDYDPGQSMILVLSVAAAIASIFAIVLELALAKGGGLRSILHVLITTYTVIASWVFVHVAFALHYAHDFHAPDADNSRGGLEFPGTDMPGYGDFLYHAFVIGAACATADVNITSPRMRRTAMVQGVIAFFFNTAIVALTINIAASLLQG